MRDVLTGLGKAFTRGDRILWCSSSLAWHWWQCVPCILYLTQPPGMTRARQCMCRKPQKLRGPASPNWKNPSSGNFLRLYVGTTWFQPLVAPMKNDVLLLSGNLGCFSPFERGTTLWWGTTSRCSSRRRALRFYLCSTTSLLMQPPHRWTALAGGYRAGTARKFLLRSCNSPCGPTCRPCAPGPAPVGHRYPWK